MDGGGRFLSLRPSVEKTTSLGRRAQLGILFSSDRRRTLRTVSAGRPLGFMTIRLFRRALCAAAIFVLLVLWTTMLFAAPAPGDLAAILERRKIVVAMTSDDQRPFFMAGPGGTLTGLDADMAAQIDGELGVKLEINRSAKSVNDTVDLVARGEADVAISKLSCTLSRGKKVILTRPYLVLRKALLVNRMEASRLRGNRRLPVFIQQLRGRIGVIGGSSYVGFAQQMFPGATSDGWPPVTGIRYKPASSPL